MEVRHGVFHNITTDQNLVSFFQGVFFWWGSGCSQGGGPSTAWPMAWPWPGHGLAITRPKKQNMLGSLTHVSISTFQIIEKGISTMDLVPASSGSAHIFSKVLTWMLEIAQHAFCVLLLNLLNAFSALGFCPGVSTEMCCVLVPLLGCHGADNPEESRSQRATAGSITRFWQGPFPSLLLCSSRNSLCLRYWRGKKEQTIGHVVVSQARRYFLLVRSCFLLALFKSYYEIWSCFPSASCHYLLDFGIICYFLKAILWNWELSCMSFAKLFDDSWCYFSCVKSFNEIRSCFFTFAKLQRAVSHRCR